MRHVHDVITESFDCGFSWETVQVAEGDIGSCSRGVCVGCGTFHCRAKSERPLLAESPHRPTCMLALSGRWGDTYVHFWYAPITDMFGEARGVKHQIDASDANLRTMSNKRQERASTMTFCFPSMKNTRRSILCLIRIDAADMRIKL